MGRSTEQRCLFLGVELTIGFPQQEASTWTNDGWEGRGQDERAWMEELKGGKGGRIIQAGGKKGKKTDNLCPHYSW